MLFPDIRLCLIRSTIVVLLLVNLLSIHLFRYSFECVVPLRPMLIIISMNSIRTIGITMLRVTRSDHSVQVLVMYVLVVLLSAAIAVMLTKPAHPDLWAVGASYNNIFRAFVTAFTFITSCENYNEIVSAKTDPGTQSPLS